TLGKPTFSSIAVSEGAEEEALRLVAAVESQSEHPIATAIVEGARAKGLKPAAAGDFSAVNGVGVKASVEGHIVHVGSQAFLEREGAAVARWRERADELRADGTTVVFFAIDKERSGLVAVDDPVKPSTPEAVAALRKAGIHVVMLTGDSRRTAEAVGRRLGIDEVRAEVLPQDKA